MANTRTEWIMEQAGGGTTGTANDRWMRYLASVGHSSGTLNDRLNKWYTNTLGYTGSMADKQAQWDNVYLG